MAFAHLHVHTEFSALDGMIRVRDLFGRVSDLGQTAVAITDHGNLSAAWATRAPSAGAGVKAIMGMEAYLAKGHRIGREPVIVLSDDNSADEDTERGEEEKDSEGTAAAEAGDAEIEAAKVKGKNRKSTLPDGQRERPYMHLTLLATSPEGWRNLVILHNKSYMDDAVWSKPRIDYELLAEHSAGLIVLTGCLGGPLLGPLSRAAHWTAAAAAVPSNYGMASAQAWADAHPVANGAWSQEDIDELAATHTATRVTELRDRANACTIEAREALQTLIGAVGAENVYVELMEHGIGSESAILPDAVALAREFGIGIVATNDAHHTHESDAEAHSAWLLVQSKSTFANPKFQFHGEGFFLRSEEQMRALRQESWWQEACDTTQVIADRCADKVLPEPRNLMPRFTTPDGSDNRDYLFRLLRDGAAERFGGIDKALRDRVMTEMNVIETAGMVDYFLVVHDLISWARSTAPSKDGEPEKKPILVGPGRGSAGGSMVAYLLGITQIDPVRYGLLFERFYELGRSEPPDIDIDFPQGRRQEVIQYLRDRWGAGNVASIGTFTIERTKKAINDAARVIDATRSGNAMTKLVPTVEAKPLPVGQLLNPDLPSTAEYRRLYEKDDVVRRVHQIASTFENVVAGVSVHASGIIVSAEPLFDLVPMRITGGNWVMLWTGPEAEEFGLLKVDVLGLRNLDIIDRATEYIEATTGEKVDSLALPDPDRPEGGVSADRVAAAWKLIADGRTAGIFQMESGPMTELAMKVGPRSISEESAIVALYRPGPMGMGAHTAYANRKRGIERADYTVFTSDPAEQAELAKVLGETFALVVYQEQVMQLGTLMAGFDAQGRSKLRKAVSKKKRDVLDDMKAKFFAGAEREIRDDNGSVTSLAFKHTTVQAVWDTILVFAEYAFNKAHSATYGYLAYMTAYFKANWPAAYAAANLAVTEKNEKRIQVLSTVRAEGINVLAPDVNSVNPSTAPEGDRAIRIGVGEIARIGGVGAMIAAEASKAPFTSLRDVTRRVQKPNGGGATAAGGSAITAIHVRALIESGAVDRFGPRLGHATVAGMLPADDVAIPAMEWGVLEKAARQRDYLLTTIGEHPMIALDSYLSTVRLPGPPGHPELATKPIGVSEIPDANGETVCVLAILASWSERAYSKGRMASLHLEGPLDRISGAVWDDTLTEIKNGGGVPSVGDAVLVRARVRYRAIAVDPNDPDGEETKVKELTINSISSVDGIPNAAFGQLPPSTLPRIDFTQRGEFPGPTPVLEPIIAERTPATALLDDTEPLVPADPGEPHPVYASGMPPLEYEHAAEPSPVLLMEPPAPAATSTATVPSTTMLVRTGLLVEQDRARGGSGVVGLDTDTTVQAAAARQARAARPAPRPLPDGEWSAIVQDGPCVDVNVPMVAFARKPGDAALRAVVVAGLGTAAYDPQLARLIDSASGAIDAADPVWVTCKGGVPIFQARRG